MVGFVSKGLIYLIIGILSLLAALNMGGKSSGTNQALSFLEKQTFGKAILIVLGLGLLSYSFWMVFQCIKDPEDIGDDLKAKTVRFGFLSTGLVYFLIAILTFIHIFVYQSDDVSSGKQYLSFLSPTLFTIFFILVGLVLAVQSVVLVYTVFNDDFLKKFHVQDHKLYKMIKIFAYFGYSARALILGLIAYLFFRAGIYSGNHHIKGMQDAFSFLKSSSVGTIVMVFAAAGFISYGLFYISLSRYRVFHTDN